MKNEISLNEIAIIRNQFDLLVTHLVIQNQSLVNLTKKFEKIYFDDIQKLRDNIEILTNRKLRGIE